MTQQLKKLRDVDVGADIEVGLVEADKELKQILSCPRCYIKVPWHAAIVTDLILDCGGKRSATPL
jgi:hypothetical protein